MTDQSIMTVELSREALYDRVWATPLKILAQQFGVSDAGLRKACQRSYAPLPVAGYWAKVAAGRKVQRPSLPIRPPGMSDTVKIGAGRHHWYSHRPLSDAELLGPLPPRPFFTPPLENIREACLKQVAKISVPRDLAHPHHAIAKLLAADDERRLAQSKRGYASSWDAPRFESPFEQRRLRILGALMIALAKAGASVRLTGKNGRGIYVTVHDTNLWLRLDDEAGIAKDANEFEPPKTVAGSPLILAISSGYGSAPSIKWGDDHAGRLETKLRDAVAEILVHAEASYRSACENKHEWRIERRADRLKEIHEARLKSEQAERDRVEHLKQERIARLLSEAEAFHKAETIRAYVDNAIRRAGAQDAGEVAIWAEWALGVASGIDPVQTGTFHYGIANYASQTPALKETHQACDPAKADATRAAQKAAADHLNVPK